jgi:hypothetical protein
MAVFAKIHSTLTHPAGTPMITRTSKVDLRSRRAVKKIVGSVVDKSQSIELFVLWTHRKLLSIFP